MTTRPATKLDPLFRISRTMDEVNSDGIADANLLREAFQKRIQEPTPTEPHSRGESIIIVGAGAFGSSLALELVTNYSQKYASSFVVVLS